MHQLPKNHGLRNQPKPVRSSHCGLSQWGRKTIARYLVSATTLLAPASMVTVISCGLNCNAKCESGPNGSVCTSKPASICLDAGEYSCALTIGCRCGPITDPKVGCNMAGCVGATDADKCARTPGCVWGDACRDAIDCHSLESESACRANDKQCYWSKDCG